MFTVLPATAATRVCSCKLCRGIIVAHNIALEHIFIYALLSSAKNEQAAECAYSSHTYATPHRLAADISHGINLTQAQTLPKPTITCLPHPKNSIEPSANVNIIHIVLTAAVGVTATSLQVTSNSIFRTQYWLWTYFRIYTPAVYKNEQAAHMCIIFTFRLLTQLLRHGFIIVPPAAAHIDMKLSTKWCKRGYCDPISLSAAAYMWKSFTFLHIC